MLNKKLKIKSAQDLQDENFRKMSVDKKMRLTFSLNRLIRRIAEDSIKEQYPQANSEFIEEKLREKMQP